MFEIVGFQTCEKANPEEGVEKVAIYWGATGIHAALQMEDGAWTSKLGHWEDITHPSLEALEASGTKDGYGLVKCFMKRPQKRKKLQVKKIQAESSNDIPLIPLPEFQEKLRGILNVSKQESDRQLAEF